MPAYIFPDFVAACGAKRYVRVLLTGQDGAAADFRLVTQDQVLDFIANGGLENPTHAATRPWRNNWDPSVQISVDSYNFYSGPTYGYIAFMYSPTTRMWLVKSLKKNTDPDPKLSAGSTPLLGAAATKK